MKMRVLFVTSPKGYGGTEKHLIDLVLRLERTHTNCVVLCYGLDLYADRLKQCSHATVITFATIKQKGWASYWADFVKLRPHTIVFVNGGLGEFSWSAYLAARLSGAKRVVAIEHSTARSAPPAIARSGVRNYLRRLVGWRARVMLRLRLPGLLSDTVVCVSNAVRERLIAEYGYQASKCIVNVNGVDLRHFGVSNNEECLCIRAEMGLSSSTRVIVCVASLVEGKRIDLLLEAMNRVVQDHPSCQCLIVGGGPLEKKLQAQSAQLGLVAKVRFVGHVEDVRPYLELADVFVLPSDNEGLPLSVGEAMAYGVPCIVTDVGGNREIVLHGQTGLVVERGSTEQLAKSISYLMGNSDERCRMGINAKQRVRDHFNIEFTMERLQRILLGQSEHEA